jgi:hypothetical protein
VTETLERKYAMVRIKSGDYIQPSNDATMLWRIYQYTEDGESEFSSDGKTWHKVKGIFWATAKYDRPFNNAGEWMDYDFLEWQNWLTWETGFKTRKDAVAAALRVLES